MNKNSTTGSAATAALPVAHRGRLAAYADLTKARLASLVLFTTLVGYLLASGAAMDWLRFCGALVGTALAALAANGLNQWMEVRLDRRMERTQRRPLVVGSIPSGEAFAVSIAMLIASPIVLVGLVNVLAAVLALATAGIYLIFYTPLKTRTTLCTLVGAICGALPPMIGWVGATGRLDGGAWVLAAVLFVWQIPHFLALAWLYRDDYARGGFRMLPVVDPHGGITSFLVVLYSLALLPIGLAGTLVGVAGWVYAAASLVLGLGMLIMGIDLYRTRSNGSARRVFLASIIYLPLLLGCMLADAGPASMSSARAVEKTDTATPQNTSIARSDLDAGRHS